MSTPRMVAEALTVQSAGAQAPAWIEPPPRMQPGLRRIGQ